MNKWKRSQSPSSIPRLLQNRPLTSPCSSSHSPSPVKNVAGSRIPTPTDPRRASSCDSIFVNAKQDCDANSREVYGSSSQIKTDYSNENGCNFFDDFSKMGEPLDELEMALPSDELNLDETLEELDINQTQSKLDNRQCNKGQHSDVDLKKEEHKVHLVEEEDIGQPEELSFSEFLLESDQAKLLGDEYESFIDNHKHPENRKNNMFEEITNHDHVQGAEASARQTKQNDHVIYITKNLITKLTKIEDLNGIVNLNLSLSRQWHGKIKFIENLDGLKNLRRLNLASNVISKLQNLSSLHHLEELDVSSNCIRSLDGIEALTNLENFAINDNQVESIPKWFAKKMQCLKVFKIAHNRINSLSEIEKLAALTNLSELQIKGNPIYELKHCQQRVVFHLPNLHVLNETQVTEVERKKAVERFDRDEVEKKQHQNEDLQKKFTKLKSDHDKLSEEKTKWLRDETSLIEKINNLKKTLKKRTDELHTQNQLLETKTGELSRACEKQYKLEQELTFYKLDAKFADFFIPNLNGDSSNNGKGNTSESAYIGKATYAKNHFPKDNVVLDHEQAIRLSSFLMKLNHADIHKHQELMNALSAIVTVNNQQQTNSEGERLTEGESLSKQNIVELKKAINELEEKISETEQEMHRNEVKIDNFKVQLESLDEDDPEYESISSQLKTCNKQNNKLFSELKELHKLLDDANTELICNYQDLRDSERDTKTDSQRKIKELEEYVAACEKKLNQLTEENTQLKDQAEKSKVEVLANTMLKSELQKERQLRLKNIDEGFDSKKRIEELSNELKEKKQHLKNYAHDYSILSKETDNKIHHLQMTVDQADAEIHRLNATISGKDDWKNEILRYLKSLTNDIFRNAIPQEPENLFDKVSHATLKNLKDAVTDILRNLMEDDRLKNQNDCLKETLTELNEDLEAGKDTINDLKHEIDVKDSNERVLKHELELVKENLQEKNGKLISTINEYDDIAKELKNKIQLFEKKNEALGQERQTLQSLVLKEKKAKNDLSLQMKTIKNIMDNKIKETQSYAELVNLKNTELLETIDSMSNELKASRVKEEEMKLKMKSILHAKDNQHQKELRDLTKELHFTNDYLENIMKDYGQQIDVADNQIESLCDMLDELQNKVEMVTNQDPHAVQILNELKTLKNSFGKFNDAVERKKSMNKTLSKIMEDIDALKAADTSEDTIDSDGVARDKLNTNKALLKILEQIQNMKSTLQQRELELDTSLFVPRNIMEVKQKEIQNLLSKLKEKEAELKEISQRQMRDTSKIESCPPSIDAQQTFNPRQRGMTNPSFIASTPIHPNVHHIHNSRLQDSSECKPNVSYHDHYLIEKQSKGMAQTEPKKEEPFCNISRHKNMENQIKNHEESIFKEKMKQFHQGRDELRWELSRLEAKIGDAVVRRSVTRHSNRFPIGMP